MRRNVFDHAGLAALAVAFASLARAADRPESIAGFLFPNSNSVDYTAHDAPGPKDDPDVFEQRARATFLVSKTAADTWSVHQALGEFHFSNPPAIRESGLDIPQTFYETETGGAYQHRLGDRRDWGISAGAGSASDKLFHTLHETTFRATGTYRFPSKGENSWLLLLSYSNNRHFANNVPFPGAAYLIHSASLDAALGLPFLFISYRPTTRWNLRGSIFGPQNLSTEIAYKIAESVQPYAGFDWGQREWQRANRLDNADRLFYDEKKWAIGIRFPVTKAIRLDLSGNYEFDRRLYENSKAATHGIPEADLNPTLAFQAKVSTRW